MYLLLVELFNFFLDLLKIILFLIGQLPSLVMPFLNFLELLRNFLQFLRLVLSGLVLVLGVQHGGRLHVRFVTVVQLELFLEHCSQGCVHRLLLL